ncbi:hypothetical protein [Luteimonas rhizosphaerae]|uniref:hypothetical protein n=1 Tax=Luteimonas sp. 4-12 TaxID=2027406 RepID=UPI0011816987|nr:hypothetical protein [Luteimonas sp. 4-12]
MNKLVVGGVMALVFAAASAGADAQEMQLRSGVVTAITAIQQAVAAQPRPASNGGGALGRAFGRVAGRAVGRMTNDGVLANDAYQISSGLGQDLTAGQGGAQATGTAYLVLVRFNDGTESAIQTASASNLAIGHRVRVIGTGNSAQVVPE